MKLTILGSGAGLPSKNRNTQSIILDLVEEANEYILIDAGEALQHRILHTNIKPAKIKNIFITHLHGDHIYGLLGFLSSRANQGGENVPLNIFGPKHLKEWIEQSFRISSSRINFPIYFYEVSGNEIFELKHSGFKVFSYPLDHTIDSFLYVFKEPDQLGRLNTQKLKSIGIQPGPKLKEIKASQTFEHNGKTYNSKDFLGPTKKGRKISVHGDTRPIKANDYYKLINNSDVIVHESTYLNNEKEKAHQYLHSEMNDVLLNLKGIQFNQLVFNHISNRYEDEFLNQLTESLPDNVIIAKDYTEITIPRIQETL